MNNVIAISTRFTALNQEFHTQNYASKKALHTVKLVHMLLASNYKFDDQERKLGMLAELQSAVKVIESFIQ